VVDTVAATALAEGGDRSCLASRSHAAAGIIAKTAKNVTTGCLRTRPSASGNPWRVVTFLRRYQMLKASPKKAAPARGAGAYLNQAVDGARKPTLQPRRISSATGGNKFHPMAKTTIWGII
jgi:hypothetical protein